MDGDSGRYFYRECLRNHAASLGSYATDGCGEFTLDETWQGGGGQLQCAACGCHRNFHRKVTNTGGGRGVRRDPEKVAVAVAAEEEQTEWDRSSKKRFRTKFTEEQKEKMLAFAEKLGWKLQRREREREREEEDEIEAFCRGVGVSRQVFKVWMHNHKNASSSSSQSTGNASSLTQ